MTMTLRFSNTIKLLQLHKVTRSRPIPIICNRTSSITRTSALTRFKSTSGDLHKRYASSSSPLTYDHDLHRRPEENVDSSSNPNPSSKQAFLLADIGEGIYEVELLEWYVNEGQTIQQFDKVCEVQSDKATVDITSRFDGTIGQLCHDTGDMVKVGSPLLFMSGKSSESELESSRQTDNINTSPTSTHVTVANDAMSISTIQGDSHLFKEEQTPITQEQEEKEEQGIPIETLRGGRKVLATPAVRRLCMEYSIDLASIQGSGKGGRILKSDVFQEMELQQDTYQEVHPANDNENVTALSDAKITNDQDVVEPIRGFSRIMVNSMTGTLQVPHMCYSDEVDMSALKECREQLKPMAESKGIKLSYLPFAIKACSLAMKEYPLLNTSIDAEQMTLTYHANHDIGVAIDSPRGLVVPVLRKCQNMSIMDIAVELARLRELAIDGLLTEDNLSNPTFSLSNIGAIGGTYMSPVVLPPQVAIGAMGKIQRLPRFVNDNTMEVKEAHLMSISWGGDHRVIDGGTLGRFSNVFKTYMESPMAMAFTMK